MEHNHQRRPQVQVDGLIVVLILLVGFALRIHNLGLQSLWEDELISAVRSSTVTNAISLGSRYVFYGLALHTWMQIFATSDFALRFSSVIASMIAVAFVWKIGRQYGTRTTRLYMTAMIAVLPLAVWYAQELRNYSLKLAFAMAVVFFATRLDKQKPFFRLGFYASIFLVVLTHALSIFFVGTVLFVLIVRRLSTGVKTPKSGEIILGFVFAVLPVILMFTLDSLQPQDSVSEFAGGLFWISLPTLQSLRNYVFEGLGFWVVTLELIQLPILIWQRLVFLTMAYVLVSLGALIFAARTFDSPDWKGFWGGSMLLSVAVIPSLALFALSYLYQPIWSERYLIPSLVCMALFAAWSISKIPLAPVRQVIIGVLLLLSVLLSRQLSTDPTTFRPDIRGGLQYIGDNASQQDVVFTCGNAFVYGFERYQLVNRYFPNDGRLSLSQDELEFISSQLPGSIWLIEEPDQCNLHEDVQELLSGGALVEEADFHQIMVQRYTFQ